MTAEREIRCYEYVNHGYERVSRLLVADPTGLFQRATSTAAARAEALVSKLKVSVAGLEVGKDVKIEVDSVATDRHPPGEITGPAMALTIHWSAATGAAFFPSMRAELLVYPLSAEETQLDLRGWYTPPGGLVGGAADALVGHRVAEASVHRFLQDVAARLSAEAS